MAINLGKYHKSLNLKGDVTPDIKSRIFMFFNNSLLFELITIMHSEFMLKAQHGTDSVGTKWQPLSPKLVEWKRKTKRPIVRIGPEPLINIRYGKLEKALRPGRFTGEQYHPRANQQIRVTAKTIDFLCTIPYAGEVQSVRPFVPDEIEPWLDEAATKSIPRLLRFVKRIRDSR